MPTTRRAIAPVSESLRSARVLPQDARNDRRMAMSLLPGRRYGAERRLPYGKGGFMNGVLFMLALVLLLMVLDRMRQ